MSDLVTCAGCGASLAEDAVVTHQLWHAGPWGALRAAGVDWMSSGHPVARDDDGVPIKRSKS